MKKIQTEKIEFLAKKYILDICLAALFLFFALVLAERPKADLYETEKQKIGVPEQRLSNSLKHTEKAAPAVAPKSPQISDSPVPAKESNNNPDPSDFYTDEFRIQDKDIRKLCEAIKSDGYKLGAIEAAGNRIEWLNEVLKVPDLFDKAIAEKPGLVLTGEIRKLKEQTEGKRDKPFKQLKDEEQEKIKRLNRLILELAYPQETPKIRHLEVRNIFEPEGNYEKPPELIIIPENPYNLIAVLEGKEKRAILREYTGRMVSFKTGDKMIDGAVVTSIDRLGITVKKGKKKKEYRIFDVKNKKGNR